MIVDLADIDNLKNSTIAKKISADFSAVTNSILSISPFYKGYEFEKSGDDLFRESHDHYTSQRSTALSF